MILVVLVLNDLVLLAVGWFAFSHFKRTAKAEIKVRAKARIREHEDQLQEHEDRWQGRLVKCDHLLAQSEANANLARAALIEAQNVHQRINEQVHRVDTVLMDPRVRQALS